MKANLIDIWHMVVNYQGTGFLVLLYLVAFVYLCITEKEKKNRLLLIYTPVIVMLMIACPIYYRLYMGYLDDSGTYYRMMWLIPMLVTLCYSACKAIYKHKRVGCIVIIALIVICGSFTYTSVETKKVENPYHIPGYVIELCDNMTQDIPGVNVYACVPLEMLFYTRQYDSEICLLYGREAAEPKWGYYDPFFELYELAEVLDWDEMLDAARNNDLGTLITSYYVVAEDREMVQTPESVGLEEVCRSGGYVLYRDPVAVTMVREMLAGTPYMQ